MTTIFTLIAIYMYGHNGRCGLIIAQVCTISGQCSPIHIVRKLMKLCDYVVEKKSKSIACIKLEFAQVHNFHAYIAQ